MQRGEIGWFSEEIVNMKYLIVNCVNSLTAQGQFLFKFMLHIFMYAQFHCEIQLENG